MKKTLTCVFTLLGSIVGAGFLSGRELVRFFGVQGFLPLALLSALVFFFFIRYFLFLGARMGGWQGVMHSFPKRAVALFRFLLGFSCFVCSSGMFAGLNALLPSPALNVFLAALVFLICRGGIEKINVVNLVFVPFALLFFAFAFLRAKAFSYGGTFAYPKLLSCVLYAGMNIFLSVPVLCDLGDRVKEKLSLSAFLAGAVLFFGIFFLLCAIRSVPFAEEAEIPLLSVAGGNGVYPAIAVFGCFTSLLSAYYALYHSLCGKKANAARVILLLAAFALSFFGFQNIVEYGYPVLGAVGTCLLFACVGYEKFLQGGDGGVHRRRHQAKKGDGGHHEIELKHLPAVHDKVPQPRLRNDVFAHDGADPSHAHVDL